MPAKQADSPRRERHDASPASKHVEEDDRDPREGQVCLWSAVANVVLAVMLLSNVRTRMTPGQVVDRMHYALNQSVGEQVSWAQLAASTWSALGADTRSFSLCLGGRPTRCTIPLSTSCPDLSPLLPTLARVCSRTKNWMSSRRRLPWKRSSAVQRAFRHGHAALSAKPCGLTLTPHRRLLRCHRCQYELWMAYRVPLSARAWAHHCRQRMCVLNQGWARRTL